MPKKDKLKACSDCEGTEFYLVPSILRSDKIICNQCGKLIGFASLKSGTTKTK